MDRLRTPLRPSRTIAAVAFAALLFTACGCSLVGSSDPAAGGESAAPPAAASDEVTIAVTMAFESTYLEVDAGTTVTWQNTGEMPHTVTSVSGPVEFDNALPAEGSTSITFDTPGTYEYECLIHSGMTGTIVVT